MKVNGYEIKPFANLRGAYFRGADLRGTNLKGADLRGADLRGADFEGATLRGADLRDAKLEGAKLEGADLEYANVKGTILEKKEEPQDTPLSQWIKELEEENKKLKDTLKSLKALLDA